MTPEAKARQQIDQKLEAAGWVIQDMKQLNLGAAAGRRRARIPHRHRPGRLRAVRQSQAGAA